MEDQLNAISQKIENLDSFLSNKINERDEIIKVKDARITELTDKLVIVSKEKDDALWAKIDLMKQISAEREDVHGQISALKKEVGSQTEKMKKYKAKSRAAQDGLIGSSFEQDRLKKEVEESTKAIEDFKEKAASVAAGETGIIYSEDIAIKYMTGRIKEANRSLRIVSPTIEFLKRTGLYDAMNELPKSSVVNIATSLDIAEHHAIIEEWKEKGWVVHNYNDKNFLMISANGSDIGIAYYSEAQISGFYSNIDDLIMIFKQALMHPFIKGQKL